MQIAAITLVSGCVSPAPASSTSGGIRAIQYYQDTRSGVCFAAASFNTYGFSQVTSFTAVPCTASVTFEAFTSEEPHVR
jgi:hypothetical protein